MAILTVSTESIFKQPVDTLGFIVEQDNFSPAFVQGITALFPAFESARAKHGFVAKASSSMVLTGSRDGNVVDLIFVGVGKADKANSLELYRRALGALIRMVESRKGTSLAIAVPQAAFFALDATEMAKQTVIAVDMARYHFDEFITDKDRKIKDLQQIIVVSPDKDFAAGIEQGRIIADAVNQCRRWIDLPAESLHPVHLAEHALDVAKKYGLKVTRFTEQEICQMGMGGLCGVSKGSERDCQFVILEYSCGTAKAPTLGFVGKGITFDSGGLSIKPSTAMETMKDDMSGAAAVINAMQALAQLKPNVNIIGITPISENLPSGKATKPGDVVTFYNGKTAEVKNTDAEGRLILADALSYAVKHYKLDMLIDLATLTGACAYALGPQYTGLMSRSDELVDKLMTASIKAGDRLWRLPLTDEYKVAIKSSVADLCNSGNPRYRAGAITAGLFLENFVGDVPWVHLDIAGSAFDVPDMPYYRSEGATGVGVRLLIELAMNWR